MADTAGPFAPALRRRLAPVVATVGVALGLLALTGPAAPARAGAEGDLAAQTGGAPTDDELIARGEDLYRLSCVSCHGPEGRGQDTPDGTLRGPSIVDAGEAGAYYQLTTGRMPLANPSDIPTRKDPAFSDEEIDALVAFVASLGDGPALPDVDVAAGDLAEGGVLFRESCQACHSATGAGGALSYGRAAPPLAEATPTQVAAAIRSGPGPMPRFGDDIFDDHQVDSISRYVDYLEEPDDRGGLALGRLGPIPEGFMVWVGGLGALLILAFWLGTRRATQPVAPTATTPLPADAPVPAPGNDDPHGPADPDPHREEADEP